MDNRTDFEVKASVVSDAFAFLHDLNQTKKRIILYLKQYGELTLQQMSDLMGISKMAILKQVRALERSGIVTKSTVITGKRGRPNHIFRLTNSGKMLFPNSYPLISQSALDFIETKLGKHGIEEFFGYRNRVMLEKVANEVGLKNCNDMEKLEEFKKLRNKDGYMFEFKILANELEIIQYNCPLYTVASKYPEACRYEKEFFEKLFGCPIENVSTIVSNKKFCKFKVHLS